MAIPIKRYSCYIANNIKGKIMRSVLQRRLAIIGIALPTMAVGMNFSIVNMAMPTLQKQFDASISELQWLLNAFGIFLSVLMVTMGKLADKHGRRRLYLIGTVFACGASLISGLAPKLGWIIVAQAVQGMSGAIIIPISQALLSYLYPEEQRSHAIGIWATIACTSLGLGPIVGGSILEFLGWRWIFLINVPIALLSIYPLLKFVPESKSKHPHAKIDFRGVFLLMLTIGSLVVTIMQAPEWGLKVLWTGALFLLSLILFILSEKKSESPIIRPDFFFQRTFLFSTLANFFIVFFVWGDFFLLPYYLQNEHAFSPLQTGLLMLLVTAPVVFFSAKVGRIYDKTGPKVLMLSGFILLALSGLIQVFFNSHSIILPLIATFCFGIGWVISWGPSITSAISSVPRDAAGLASAAFTTVQEIGGTMGLTIAGTAFRIHDSFASGAFVLCAGAILGLIFTLGLKKTND